jgi:hypothetical protein
MKMRIICILCLLLFAGFVQSAVLYDNNASATMNHDIYLPIAYSTPANSNRLMLVSVVWMTSGTLSGSRCNVCAESGVFSGCSYGGYNLLNLKTTTNNEVLYLYNPPTSGTLECYWEDICHVDAVVGVTTFSGVSQTAGLGDAVDASGSASPITTALIGVSANNLFWDSVAVARGSAPTMTITPVVGQNPNWNKKAGADKCSTYPLGASSWKQGLSGSTTLNWTESTNKAWWTVGVEVKASTAAGNTAPNSSLVYLLNGTAGTTLGTPYKNNPIYYNASGNCSDLENSTLTGVFNFYLNGSFWQNFTTYNWNANKTNYTNTSVTGLNKSDSLFVGLLCLDGAGGLWSNQTNSTRITINNTAPVIGAPSVNNSLPIKTSVLLCTNGSYSDADSDVIGLGRWRWWLNGTEVGGQTAQALTLSAIGANETDKINCSYKTEDSGYDVKNSTEMFSTEVIIQSGCGTITTDTKLYNNLTSSGTCITIGADYITLDCNGFTLNEAGNGYGIYANYKHNINIKNCILNHFSYGVYMVSVTYSNFSNITSQNNHLDGIYSSYSSYDSYDNLTLIHNGAYGLSLRLGSYYNNITNVFGSNNTQSHVVIREVYNLGTRLINITVVDSPEAGILLDNSPETVIINITSMRNGYGAYVAVGSSIVVFNDSLLHNNTYGLRYLTSSGMKANNITISNSSSYGLWLYYASSTLLLSNSSISDSGVYDVFMDTAPTGGHILQNTTFNSSKIGYYSCNVNCNFTSQWYARLNVTNTTDPLPASVNVSDVLGGQAYSTTLGASGLSPWFIVNDTIYSGAGNTALNPHSINASYAGYALNSTSFTFNGRDFTLNLTLYLAKIHYPPGRRWWNDTAIVEASGVYEDEDQKPGFSWLPVLASGGGLLWLTVFGRPAA